jgi:sugar lactone lactonase YvrE
MINKTGLSVERMLNHSSLLGEGPVWDIKTATLCWVDILNGRIHEYSPETKSLRTIEVQETVGAIAVCTDGNFVAALQHGFAMIERNNGRVKKIADPEGQLPGNRFNDGKCDPAGRFWAGTMAYSEQAGAGNLYMLQKNLAVQTRIRGVTVSNGMAWSGDQKTFYYIDTPTGEVVAYDYENDMAEISNKRTVIKIAGEDGWPDGMTIDREGMLWIAHWDGWQLTRWDPQSGEKLTGIQLPAARITSCTFGGENLEDIYITSARTGLSENELEAQPLAGAVFVCRKSGFSGIPASLFRL